MIFYQAVKHSYMTQTTDESKFMNIIILVEDKQALLQRKRSILYTLISFRDLLTVIVSYPIHTKFISHSAISPLKQILKLP
jgi:hypothetical protein